MKAVNGMVKVLVCGTTAMAVTFVTAFSLVRSTDIARWVDMPTVVITAKAEAPAQRVAQSATAGLLQ